MAIRSIETTASRLARAIEIGKRVGGHRRAIMTGIALNRERLGSATR